MLKETINSLKGVLYERISSPLWGTYIISFSIWNWSALLIIISDNKPMAEKVEFVKTTYVYTEGVFNYSIVFYPLLISATLLMVIPALQTLHFIYTEYVKAQGKIQRDKFESSTRLSIEQSNDLRQRIFNVQTSSQEITSFQDRGINALKENVLNLRTELDSSEQNDELSQLVEQLQRAEAEKAALSAKVAKTELELSNSKTSIKVDAVDIEYAFARIIGNNIGDRGTKHDADIFRGGNLSNIAAAMESAISSIDKRINKLPFRQTDRESGEIGAQLKVAFLQLKKICSTMKKQSAIEPSDYHWGIVANLLTVINTLIVMIERNQD
ncbi:MAG: hypothetical protein OCC45_02480 [Desulfotalea sp.]